MKIDINRRTVIISLIVFLTIVVAVIIMAIFFRGDQDADPGTGGSGVPESGTVIISNLSEPDPDGIKLGEYMSTKVLTNIQNTTEYVLTSIERKPDYRGNVVSGSVLVNHPANTVRFRVHFNNPDVTLHVSFKTTDDDIYYVGDTETDTL